MTSSAPRAPIDFDAFERDLRQATVPAGDSPAVAGGDPLAELARIVGRDDPFRALLQARQAQGGERAGLEGASPRGRVEPSFFEAAPASAVSPADAFDQYLANVEQQGAPAQDDDEAHHAEAQHGQDPAAFEDTPAPGYRSLLAKRPRGQLVQVGAGLGVLVLCVTGALGWKLLRPHGSDGGPVTVLADRSPLKVAPTAADGVEIPDQNKQIYERKAKDGQIKVVNREEQPLDVAQAARAGRDGGPTTPGQTAMLTDSLGEPRRVRTVSVRPDTPPASVQKDAQRDAPPPRETQVASADPTARQAPPSAIPTMTMPDSAGATPDAAPPSRRPSRTLASTSAPANAAASVPAKPSPVADAPTPPAAAQTAEAQSPAPRRKASQRIAAAAPEAPAPAEDTQAAAADASPASTASVGGYSVQLGVRNSEADAQAAFRQMQDKYSQLAGKPSLIRHAEVDGKSLYRVRVGPLAKAEASSLCGALKSAGGQCFIAKN